MFHFCHQEAQMILMAIPLASYAFVWIRQRLRLAVEKKR